MTIKQNPQVSIGMPIYNGEKFIREALDSLLAQTFTNFELIISDNASTDCTEAICREYANQDNRVRYVRQSVNLGPVTNFEFVLNEAIGEYFMWAATDDKWDIKWIETLLKNAGPRTISYGITIKIDVDGRILTKNPIPKAFYIHKIARLLGLILSSPTAHNYVLYGLYSTEYIKTSRCFSIYRTSISKYTPNGDELYFLFMALLDCTIVSSDAIFYYRVGSGISSKRRSSMSLDKLYELILFPIKAANRDFKLLTLVPDINTRIISYPVLSLAILYKLLRTYATIPYYAIHRLF
ncbi:MAG: glycosyltransferase family 2 protein [Methylococcaceae bacterium]